MARPRTGDLGARYKWRDGRYGATTREGVLHVAKVRREPIKFNSGPTPRHAILDFMRLIQEYPEAW